jgi:hypothetical protein
MKKEAVEEFKKIYKEMFKEDLNDAEASRKARKLLGLYKTIYCSACSSQQKEKEIKIMPNEHGSREK